MSLEHEFVQQSLADKDINSSVKDGKIVVHKDNSAAAKSHLKKIGYGHVQVVTEQVFSFIDYLIEETGFEDHYIIGHNHSLYDNTDKKAFIHGPFENKQRAKRALDNMINRDGSRHYREWTTRGSVASGKDALKKKANKLGIKLPDTLSEDYILENYSLEEIELFLESQEYEQLDEISKQVLSNYIKKAEPEAQKKLDRYSTLRMNKSARDGEWSEDTPNMKKIGRKASNREAGVNLAKQKLSEEELDEISKQTLGSYIRKASLDKGQADYRRGMNKGVSIATLGKDDKNTSDDETTSQKRMKGIYAATRKLSEGVFAPGQIIRSMDSGAKVKIDKVHHDDKMYVGTDVQNGSKDIAIPFHKASYYDENYTD